MPRRPGSQTETGERRRGPLTPRHPPTPTPSRGARLRPSDTSPGRGVERCLGPAWACSTLSPKLNAYGIEDTLLWPHPVPPAGWWARPRGPAPNSWEVPLRPAHSESLPPGVSGLCDLRPSQGLGRLLSPPLRFSPLQFFCAEVRPEASLAAPGLDNGRSDGAEPEVRLRTRSLAPATQGSGERADYTSQRPPRAPPQRPLGSKPHIFPGAAAGGAL